MLRSDYFTVLPVMKEPPNGLWHCCAEVLGRVKPVGQHAAMAADYRTVVDRAWLGQGVELVQPFVTDVELDQTTTVLLG